MEKGEIKRDAFLSCALFFIDLKLGVIYGPIQTMLEKFENAKITGHFGFVFDENSIREIS